MGTDNLGPQFLYHGTADEIRGDRILPASEHGGRSHWGDTGSSREEPANKYAWAHPDEHETWHMALDRANFHVIEGNRRTGEEPVIPRARVYAVHPNAQQSSGHDPSIPGEVKSTHFKISHAIDTQPGYQGTFPGVNWNEYTQGSRSRYLAGDEDANHPGDMSIRYGHEHGVWGDRDVAVGHLMSAARKEDEKRYMDHLQSRGGRPLGPQFTRDESLPGMPGRR